MERNATLYLDTGTSERESNGMKRNGTEYNEGEDRGKGESCVARGSYELSLSLSFQVVRVAITPTSRLSERVTFLSS